jgi:hypothetical protein
LNRRSAVLLSRLIFQESHPIGAKRVDFVQGVWTSAGLYAIFAISIKPNSAVLWLAIACHGKQNVA